MPTAISYRLFRTSSHVSLLLHVLCGVATGHPVFILSVLSDRFSEGKLKDLSSSFPPDQPTELDSHEILDDSDLEDIEEDAKLTISISEATSEYRGSLLKSPIFSTGFSSSFEPQITRLGNIGGTTSICSTRSVGPDTHLGKVVVLRDISFVT